MRKNYLNQINFKFFTLFLSFIASFLLLVNIASAQSPEEVKFYSERIEFGTDEVKRNALHDLRNFESEIASRIALPALKDSSEIIRATATHSVIFLPKQESANNLTPLLNDPSEFVRRETAYALGKTKNPSVAIDLIKSLQMDKKQSVKDASAVSLGLIGNENSIFELLIIFSRKPNKKQAFFRRAAVRSIGQIIESIRQYEPTLITPQSFLPPTFKDLKPTYFTAEFENSDKLRFITNNLITMLLNPKEDKDTRRETAFALGAIGQEESIEVLRKYSTSEDLYLAEICIEALLKISN